MPIHTTMSLQYEKETAVIILYSGINLHHKYWNNKVNSFLFAIHGSHLGLMVTEMKDEYEMIDQ